jgi:hypothetical protein
MTYPQTLPTLSLGGLYSKYYSLGTSVLDLMDSKQSSSVAAQLVNAIAINLEFMRIQSPEIMADCTEAKQVLPARQGASDRQMTLGCLS